MKTKRYDIAFQKAKYSGIRFVCQEKMWHNVGFQECGMAERVVNGSKYYEAYILQ